MGTQALMIWSMALGAIAAVAAARVADFAARPTRSQLRAISYHVGVFLLVLVLSGVLRQVVRPGLDLMEVLQVLAGPVCVGLSNHWIHGWLGAAQRDRFMGAALRLSAGGLPLLAVSALWLPQDFRLPTAAMLALAGSGLTCWLTFRAWMFGDRLALWMAAGCALTLPAIAGLYVQAIGLVHWGAGMQALVALCAAMSNGLTGAVLARRERHLWRTRETGSVPALDPVTRLHSSAALVHRLVASQKRRRRTQREGAVLAVMVFDAERIAAEAGSIALDEVWMTLAARIQRQVGVVNPVGRYWDRCFVALVETIPARASLRRLGLKLAASLRRPMEVTGRDGEPTRVRVEIGVGIVHLPPFHPEVEDVLADAQRLAHAARRTASRTAISDPATGATVPVEDAQFDTRHAKAAHRPPKVVPLQRGAG